MPSDHPAQFEGEHDDDHEPHAGAGEPSYERHESHGSQEPTHAAPAHDDRAPEPAAPPAPAAHVEPAPVAESSAPRRRSTVRERAPVDLGSDAEAAPPSPPQPVEPPQPVVTGSADGETADQPRRSGWWRKR